MGVEPAGRVVLPRAAREVLGLTPGRNHTVGGICRCTALVLRPDAAGAALAVDGRGRLRVPVWLRRGDPDTLLVGVHHASRAVVVTATNLLDDLGDELAEGDPR